MSTTTAPSEPYPKKRNRPTSLRSAQPPKPLHLPRRRPAQPRPERGPFPPPRGRPHAGPETARQHRPTRCFKRPDAIVGVGEGLVQQQRPAVARRITEKNVLAPLCVGSERGGSRNEDAVNVGAEDVPSGANLQPFCRTHERPINEESLAALLMAIDVAPPTRLQYARKPRSMLQMDRTPLDAAASGVTKNEGAIGDKAGAPPDKERDGSIYAQPDRLEGPGCF
ncbi:mucin TcMUCII, putative [Trypanosoma cruzi marinkellei]|uniref:Mucin TcMUCII, putative n=1 Tax=Trypanosoma cruzi marinkellei TaxID=85056 RepID=K2N0W9_TRYCR|nr:mucin TcMUCII, putative [Trypanosoma cruzi marinkellei]